MLKFKNIIVSFMSIIVLLCGLSIPVNASSISTYAYNNTRTYTFRSSYSDRGFLYDGNYMAIEASATSSDGSSHEIIITVYSETPNVTKKYRIYSDGITRKSSNIPLNGQSTVYISFSCSDSSVSINLNLKAYSWN